MKRLAMIGIGVSTALVATAYGMAFAPSLPPALAPTLLAVGTAGVLASVLALGAARNDRLGALWIPVFFVLVVVGGGLVALVLMPAADPSSVTLLGGLPPRAALLLYGVGLLPTLVVPVAYAMTFERQTLSEEDLARVRAARRAREEAGAAADGNGVPR